MPRTLFSFPSLCTKLKRLTLVSLPSVCSKDTQSYLALISVWMYSPRACSRFLSVCTKLTLYSVLVSVCLHWTQASYSVVIAVRMYWSHVCSLFLCVCTELTGLTLFSFSYVCTTYTRLNLFSFLSVCAKHVRHSLFWFLSVCTNKLHTLSSLPSSLYVLNTCVIACTELCLYALTSFISCPHYHPFCLC